MIDCHIAAVSINMKSTLRTYIKMHALHTVHTTSISYENSSGYHTDYTVIYETVLKFDELFK